MSETQNIYSPCGVDELFERLRKPETDAITQGELWDVYRMDQIKTYRGKLKTEIENKEKELRDVIVRDESAKPSAQDCFKHPDEPLCEIAQFTGRDNHILASRALRHYKDVQNESITLENYYQRRCIREKMEGIFGKHGYQFIERMIFLLIIVVLGMLFIEFSLNEFLSNDQIKEIETCYMNGEKGSDNSAQAANACIIDKLYGDVSRKNTTDTITVHGNIKGSFVILKTDDRIISMRYFALLDLIACMVFLTEYFLRLYLSENKAWYIKNHKIDFISSIPLTAILVFGSPVISTIVPLHSLRVLRLLRIFRAMRIATFMWRGMERLEQVAMIRMMKKSFVILISVALIGAFLFKTIESHELSTTSQRSATVQQLEKTDQARPQDDPKYATDLGQSVWWSLTTLTTGGFGDLYAPRTFGGWLLTIFLIISGIIVVGIFTASLTSIFLGQDANELRRAQAALEEQMSGIMNKLILLENNKTKNNKI